ncbi:MAG: F0F1 ATP synthase subunit delta [Anaerolineaceae bacterium]|nr:F0F1 ATP synthase subunit delta [Anaerolineaceae bacterium]
MLDINIPTIVWEILNFIVLAFLLYKLLFKRVLKMVEDRRKEKLALIEDLKQKNAEVTALRDDLESQLAEVDETVREIVDRAEQQIAVNHEHMLNRAREEATAILEEAHLEASSYQKLALDQYHENVLKTILALSGKVIAEAAPVELNEIFVKEINDRIWNLGRENIRQVQTLRQSLGDRKPTVYVSTAQELSPDQQRLLVRTFSALANRNVSVEIEIDPSLIIGTRIRMGDMIVENSIAAKLNDLQTEVRQTLEEWEPHE